LEGQPEVYPFFDDFLAKESPEVSGKTPKESVKEKSKEPVLEVLH
jgi:hypothetical protein